MINLDNVWDKFIEVAQSLVGSYLSLSGPLGDEPCVIREGIAGPIPNYPYITVSLTDVSDENGWLINEYVGENDLIVYENIKTILVNYLCFGGESSTESFQKSSDIMNILHGSFRFDSVLGDIRMTLNGSVVTLTSIQSLPVQLKDKILASAGFSVLFNIVDSLEDPNSSIIDTVDLTGEVHTLQGDLDSDQIIINVTS